MGILCFRPSGDHGADRLKYPASAECTAVNAKILSHGASTQATLAPDLSYSSYELGRTPKHHSSAFSSTSKFEVEWATKSHALVCSIVDRAVHPDINATNIFHTQRCGVYITSATVNGRLFKGSIVSWIVSSFVSTSRDITKALCH